jgi:hypothetical protein
MLRQAQHDGLADVGGCWDDVHLARLNPMGQAGHLRSDGGRCWGKLSMTVWRMWGMLRWCPLGEVEPDGAGGTPALRLGGASYVVCSHMNRIICLFVIFLYFMKNIITVHSIPKMNDDVGTENPFEMSHWIYPVVMCSTNPIITAASAASRHSCRDDGKRLKPLNNGVEALFHTGWRDCVNTLMEICRGGSLWPP